MNHLAHFHLSKRLEEVIVGNFLGDFVRQKEVDKLPIPVQHGVELHREIDLFTDAHPVVKDLKKGLSAELGRYAAVLLDVYFDFALISKWEHYSNTSLENYSKWIYSVLEQNEHLLNYNSRRFYEFMISRNLLVNYGNYDGIDQVSKGMANRSTHGDVMKKGRNVLVKNESIILLAFDQFYPELQAHSDLVLSNLKMQ